MKESRHFLNMLTERGIKPEWVDMTINDPYSTDEYDDGTLHYIKQIPEFGDRWLRVIVNASVSPIILVTAFFDRRLR